MLDSFPLLHCVSLSFIKGIYILFLVSWFSFERVDLNLGLQQIVLYIIS